MYGTVEGADTYHTDRANATWTGDDTAKEAALLRGSEWLYAAYAGRYADMPDPYDPGTIPTRLEYAAYEVALRELVSPGELSPDYVATQKVVREKVGPIDVQYAETDTYASARPVLMKVEGLLLPLITPLNQPVFQVY